jgi:hypothetical protein
LAIRVGSKHLRTYPLRVRERPGAHIQRGDGVSPE